MHYGKWGKQALKALESFVPNYIFLDVNIPEMNGRKVLKIIRQDERLSEVPIVMFSTFLDPEDIERFKKDGANECIMKPYSFQALSTRLCELLKT